MTPPATLERKYLAPVEYEPRHDPDFPDLVIGYLLAHFGQWCRLGRIFGADVWETRDAVMVGRRLGLVIEGDRQLGYRLVGFQRPRYVHLRSAAAWPPDETADVPGQLTFIDDEAIE